MSRDEILCMAREAGWWTFPRILQIRLERFAARVATAKEKELILMNTDLLSAIKRETSCVKILTGFCNCNTECDISVRYFNAKDFLLNRNSNLQSGDTDDKAHTGTMGS